MTDDPIWYHQVPHGFWTRSENRRAFMEWLEEKLSIRQPEDWYDVSVNLVERYGGGTLLRYYQYSAVELIKDYLPWYDWKEWLFVRVSRHFWSDFDNRRRYLAWLGEQMGFETMEDWYRLKTSDVVRHNGGSLIQRYKSAFRVVMENFPEYKWLPWLFSIIPQGFWAEPDNVRWYLEWIGEELGFEEPEDWYQILTSDLQERRGGTVCFKHGGAVGAVMKYLYPDYEWHPWKFVVVWPRDFWNHPSNVRRYLEWLAEELGYRDVEDWYGITADDFSENFGGTLLVRHGASPSAVVLKTYMPEHDWKEWLFGKPPARWWEDRRARWRYLEWLAERLGIHSAEDWGRLCCKHLITNRGSSLIKSYEWSVRDVLLDTFPRRHLAVRGILAVEDRKRLPRRKGKGKARS